MPTITADDSKIRQHIIFKADDREALLKARAKLEQKLNKPVSITETIRTAIRMLANS